VAIHDILRPMTNKKQQLENIEFVLVEPQESANIGSACRALKNMGFSRLCITGSREYDEDKVRTLAVHAFDIYSSCRRCDTLEEALAGGIFSVGATRRRGKYRKYFSYLPEQLAQHISSLGEGKISVVFGRESDGLTDEELNLCNAAVRIPADDSFPSLNLAQAVQVITYVLRSHLTESKAYQPVSREELDQMVVTAMESFAQIGFFKLDERSEVHRFYRDIFSRAGLTKRECDRLQKMFRKIPGLKKP